MRPDIIAGPAIVTHKGNTYYTEGDITVNKNPETWNVATSIHGTIDTRLQSMLAEIQFTPAPVFGSLDKYWPYKAADVGSLIFDGSEVQIISKDGEVTTYPDGAVTALPTFRLTSIATPWSGNLVITVLGDPATDFGDANFFATKASQAFSDISFEGPAPTPRYTASYGAITGIESEEGFLCDLNPTFANKNVSNHGLSNMMLQDLTGTVRFAPVGITAAQFLTLARLDTNMPAPGESMAAGTDDLAISGGGVSVQLNTAGPTTSVERYGLQPLRHGEIAFVSRKTWALGVIDDIFDITLPA